MIHVMWSLSGWAIVTPQEGRSARKGCPQDLARASNYTNFNSRNAQYGQHVSSIPGNSRLGLDLFSIYFLPAEARQ